MKRICAIGALVLLVACRDAQGDVTGRVSDWATKLVVADDTITSIDATNQVSPLTIDNESPLPTDLVRQAFDELMLIRSACGRDPFSCQVADIAVEGSPIFLDLDQLIQDRRAANIVASTHGSIRYRIDRVELLGDSRALITTCITDDVVLMDGDIIFDDAMMSSVIDFEMTKVDDGWRWTAAKAAKWTPEEDLCGFDN